MEPLVIGGEATERAELTDLALDLVRRSSGFYRSLPPPIVPFLANLVRAMNCYYSNLIEGHDTHPIDIERALKNDYSNDVRKRDLQLEAKAHIAVEEWIDHDGLKGRARRFCKRPPEMAGTGGGRGGDRRFRAQRKAGELRSSGWRVDLPIQWPRIARLGPVAFRHQLSDRRGAPVFKDLRPDHGRSRTQRAEQDAVS
jgi:hypothetical protein